MSQRERHAENLRLNNNKLDKGIMIRPLARLRGSALRGRSLGRVIVILALSMTYSVAAAKDINTPEKQQPINDVMNLKLYLHNKLNDWDQFECANQLGIKESNWRTTAVNKDSGAYGIFQHMSEYAPNWDAYTQIDKHIEYIDARYDGSWCKALRHLERFNWH
jgi:hypothetical protein